FTKCQAHNLEVHPSFASEKLAAIWCSEVLEHLFYPVYTIQELFRVCKTHGFILLTVPYHGFFKNLCIALFKWDEHFDPEHPHLRFFTKNTLSCLVRKAGFECIEM